jgi:hypothetical protein
MKYYAGNSGFCFSKEDFTVSRKEIKFKEAMFEKNTTV